MESRNKALANRQHKANQRVIEIPEIPADELAKLQKKRKMTYTPEMDGFLKKYNCHY